VTQPLYTTEKINNFVYGTRVCMTKCLNMSCEINKLLRKIEDPASIRYDDIS